MYSPSLNLSLSCSPSLLSPPSFRIPFSGWTSSQPIRSETSPSILAACQMHLYLSCSRSSFCIGHLIRRGFVSFVRPVVVSRWTFYHCTGPNRNPNKVYLLQEVKRVQNWSSSWQTFVATGPRVQEVLKFWKSVDGELRYWWKCRLWLTPLRQTSTAQTACSGDLSGWKIY